jgi:signal transduction histidine kinase
MKPLDRLIAPLLTVAERVAVQTERLSLRRAAGPLAAGTLVAGLAMVLAVAIARFWLGLPSAHVKNLAGFFLLTGGASLLVTLGAAWLLLDERRGRLAFKLGVVCVIGPTIAAINTYYTADQMLIRRDDLGLLVLLVAFSGSVGIAFALALARSLSARIGQLAHAAERLTGESLAVAVPEGGDEVGALGRTLNQLAVRLRRSEAQRRELEEARRLLLAAVSHDLRTPLTALRVVVEALDEGVVKDRQTAGQYLASARQQLRHLEALIEDLFELARLEAGALELHRAPVAIDHLVEDVAESMRARAAQAGVRLETALAPGLPQAQVDGQRIARVLHNLLDNALRYTPVGGRIGLRAEQGGATIHLSVRDSGTGMAAEDLSHVFEHFYRGEKSRSRRHGGAGLGLAIARGIVEAHGGQIWAESAPGQGTTVRFTLPAVPRHAVGTQTRPRP